MPLRLLPVASSSTAQLTSFPEPRNLSTMQPLPSPPLSPHSTPKPSNTGVSATLPPTPSTPSQFQPSVQTAQHAQGSYERSNSTYKPTKAWWRLSISSHPSSTDATLSPYHSRQCSVASYLEEGSLTQPQSSTGPLDASVNRYSYTPETETERKEAKKRLMRELLELSAVAVLLIVLMAICEAFGARNMTT